jgi:hypothetical protein
VRKKYNAEFEFIVLQLSIGGVSEGEGGWGRIPGLLGLAQGERRSGGSSGLCLKMIGNFNSLKFVILMMRTGS